MASSLSPSCNSAVWERAMNVWWTASPPAHKWFKRNLFRVVKASMWFSLSYGEGLPNASCSLVQSRGLCYSEAFLDNCSQIVVDSTHIYLLDWRTLQNTNAYYFSWGKLVLIKDNHKNIEKWERKSKENPQILLPKHNLALAFVHFLPLFNLGLETFEKSLLALKP